jgi:hypothetical protein
MPSSSFPEEEPPEEEKLLNEIVITSSLTADDVRMIQPIYSFYDIDGDGLLSSKEASQVFSVLGYKPDRFPPDYSKKKTTTAPASSFLIVAVPCIYFAILVLISNVLYFTFFAKHAFFLRGRPTGVPPDGRRMQEPVVNNRADRT